ncbi:MAG: hypothetical protein NC543_05200 [bacterium]|nr:hypothetical protein [bacterium]MCM1374365.1 hypothetical protein [Muribaculum sp.]
MKNAIENSDIENEDYKRNVIVKSIENFIETKNRYIQVILLLIAIISGVIYGLVPANVQTVVRYTLIINIFMEIYVLQAKDSIMQNKLNLIAVDVNTQNGGLRFEKDIKIDNYFENAKKDFFISGIAPSRFIQKYQPELEKLLINNNKIIIYILISSLESVPENCAEYYGTKDNKSHQYDLLSKLNVVINSIQNSEVLKNAFKEKRLLLATSNIVFTTSFVAYNIFNFKSYHSKIKITFYQQGEHLAGKLPSSNLDSDKNIRDMYPYFQNIISNQWKVAHQIEEVGELETFSKNLLCQLEQCKKKE